VSDPFMILVYVFVIGIVVCALACGMADCVEWLKKGRR